MIFWLFLLAALPAGATQFQVGDRVWIDLYAENLRDDGYAVGKVAEIETDGRLRVRISQVEMGKGRTLYGTCHPGGGSALAGAQILNPEPERLQIEKVFSPEAVKPYRKGRAEFLDRENLATLIQRWMYDSYGLSSDLLRRMAKKAENMAIPHAALAFEIMAYVEDAQGGGRGFPVPLEQRLSKTSWAMEKIYCKLRSDPDAYAELLRIHKRHNPQISQHLAAMVTEKFLQEVQEDMHELETRYPSYDMAAEQIENLQYIQPYFLQMLTKNGAQPYQGQTLDALLKADTGPWPQFP